MDISNYVSIGISLLGLVGGFVSWSLNLKIKHDIAINNERIDKQFFDLKDTFRKELDATYDRFEKDFTTSKDKLTDRFEHLDRDLIELKSNLADRILSIVNGKYVRTDLHQQTIASVHERFVSFKEIIEVSMERIEQSLGRQLLDLKERIFQPGK